MRLFVALLLLVACCAAQGTLQPVLSCWFLAYPNTTTGGTPQRTLHLVLGYENTAPAPQIIYVQRAPTQSVAPRNLITPLDYNGAQPDVFKVGVHALLLDLSDARNLVLSRTQNVTWALGARQLVVTYRSLRANNRCDVRYATHCPVKMPGFCEDGMYCNGRERCYADFVYTAAGEERFGACEAALEQPCAATQQCDERTASCVIPLATAPPTIAVAPSTNVSETPSEAAANASAGPIITPPSSVVTAAPSAPSANATAQDNTAVVPARTVIRVCDCTETQICTERGCVERATTAACASQTECDALSTFCQGAATCSDGRCLYNASYNACPVHNMSAPGSGILQMVCSNEQLACLHYYYCVVDADCDNRRHCDGAETCEDGVCRAGTPIVCPNPRQSCTETHHCGAVLVGAVVPTAAPTPASSDGAWIIGFSIGISVTAAVLLLCVVLFYIWTQRVKQQALVSARPTTLVSRLGHRRKGQ